MDVMMYNKVSTLIKALLCLAVLFCQQACNVANLDLCYEEHPHRGQMIVDFDWSELNIEKPDSMVVVALRPEFRDKMSCLWATEKAKNETRLYGRLIAPCEAEERVLYANVIEEMPQRDSLYLPAGEWIISAYTSNDETIELTKQYTEDIQADNEAFYFKMSVFEKLPEKYAYWYDRNPASIWVDLTPKKSVCFASASLTVDENANIKKDYKVRLKPATMTQNVHVSFDAELDEEDIEVDSIVCSMSGLVGVVNLQNNVLDIEKTYQGIFKADIKKTQKKQLHVSSTLNVLGIIRSSSHTFLQGPGILNVSVFVKYEDKAGVRRQRRLDGTTNLYWQLTDNPSVKYNEDGKVVQTKPKVDLHISSKLRISKGKLSNASDALDSWVDETIIDTEI